MLFTLPVGTQVKVTLQAGSGILTTGKIVTRDQNVGNGIEFTSGILVNGSPKDQTLTVWHGAGCNSKGTFIGIVQQILGPYSTTIPVDSLVTKKSGDTNLGGVAMLCGVRLAVAQEGEMARRFNAGLIKTLTGGDRLTGKILWENKFEWGLTKSPGLSRKSPGARAE